LITPVKRRVGVFFVLLFLGLGGASGCGGGDENSAPEPTPSVQTSEEEAAGAAAGDPEAGAAVFASAGCGGCHTLAAAGSGGTTGPNLDDAQPGFDRVLDRVTNGAPGMPSFAGQLSTEEIRDVAAYVVASTGG
jgi:mono/diheme cytochrome c family protein